LEQSSSEKETLKIFHQGNIYAIGKSFLEGAGRNKHNDKIFKITINIGKPK
jgi:hypothetical protein